MYIKDQEQLEVILSNNPTNLSIWLKKIGYVPKINVPIKIHWTLLKTTRKFRNLKLTLKCDDCQEIFNRRIKDLSPNKKIHYCNICFNKGIRNGRYGTKYDKNAKEGFERFIKKHGNPFTWDSSKKKIKAANGWQKSAEKNKGKKRTQETKDTMSRSGVLSYKEGRSQPGKKWGKIVIKQYKGIDYQSSYELKFLLYVDSLNALHLIERGPKISYVDNEGKEHVYFSDFMIKNTKIVFEVKSTYTWNNKLEINLIKKQTAEKSYNYFLIMDNNFSNVSPILNEYN